MEKMRGCIRAETPTDPPADHEEYAIYTFFNSDDSIGFKFEETDIDTLDIDPDIAEDLKARQRIFRIVPAINRLDAMRIFRSAGLDSAQSIVSMGYGSFMKRFSGALGGAGAANKAWSSATDRALAAQMWTVERVQDIANIGFIGAFDTNASNSTAQGDWTTMFGSLDFCECEHCKSVHGPAAYLADLLNWLEGMEENPPPQDQVNPVNVLFERRPDLEHLKLSCQNTNTIVPYVDLANEVMENTICDPPDYSALQTTKTSEELEALPEHDNEDAYTILKEAPYPWSLPFDKEREEVWPLFSHLGYERHAWRRLLRKYSNDPNEENQAAIDQLGFSEVERKIVLGLDLENDLNFGAPLGTPPQYDKGEDYLWGLDGISTWYSSLQNVNTFLTQASFNGPGTKLDYITLRQLIVSDLIRDPNDTNLLNSYAGLIVEFDPNEPCALAKATLKVKSETPGLPGSTQWVAYFSLMRRFLHLQNKLGWSVLELDKALVALGTPLKHGLPGTDQILLTELARVEKLRADLNIPLLELLSWFGLIDTADDRSEEKDADKELSLYERVFQASPQEYQTFKLNTGRTDLDIKPAWPWDNPLVPSEAKRTEEVAGALRISTEDLGILAEYLGGAPELNLQTLSSLYRICTLSKYTKVSIRQMLSVFGLTNLNQADVTSGLDTDLAVDIIQRLKGITSSSFSIEELDYLFRHEFRAKDGVAPTVEEKAQALWDIQSGLKTIQPVSDSGSNSSSINETLEKKKQVIVQKLATNMSLSSDVIELLVDGILTGGADSINTAQDDLLLVDNGGLWATYYATTDLEYTNPPPNPPILKELIDSPLPGSTTKGFDLWNPLPEFLNGVSPFSVRWVGYIRAVKSGEYCFEAESSSQTNLWIEEQRINANSDKVQLQAGRSYAIRLELTPTDSAAPTSMKLKWIIPGASLMSVVPTDRLLPPVLMETYELVYKACVLASKLNLSATDLTYLDGHSSDLTGLKNQMTGGFKLDDLPLSIDENDVDLCIWEQLRDIWQFSSANPSDEVRVIDVLGAAQTSLTDARTKLLSMTEWEAAEVDRLCNWDTSNPDDAIQMVKDLRTAYEAHRLDTNSHENASSNEVATTAITNLTEAITIAKDIRNTFELHCVELHNPIPNPVHDHKDNANAIVAEEPTNLPSLVIFANEIKRQFNAHCSSVSMLGEAIELLNIARYTYEGHRVSSGVHEQHDDSNVINEPEAFDYLSAEDLANELKLQYAAHRINAEETAGHVHQVVDSINQVNAINVSDNLQDLKLLANDLKNKIFAHAATLGVENNFIHRSESDIEDLGSVPDVGAANVHLRDDSANTVNTPSVDLVVADDKLDALEVSLEDLQTGRKLVELYQCMKQMTSLGLKAAQLVEWSRSDVGRDLNLTVREVIRSKYAPDKWLGVIGKLRNDLRRKQRDALGAYLVGCPESPLEPDYELKTINDLYGVLLIDAGMEPCMKTSRLKLALSSVQLFVQRCIMGLEAGIQLVPIQEKEWQWRKNYRVWEANRKVFLFPENWIEPELRDDKTPFFKELESELLEGEVTADSAEKAYRHYLEKLADVARLEIAGACEDTTLIKEKTIHIVGRTRGTPHQYYYRSCKVDLESQTSVEWTPWESVDLDIDSDHVMPVMWNRRLHLFWPVFEEKVKSVKVRKKRGATETERSNWRYLKLKIAYSRFSAGEWSPTKSTKSNDDKAPEFDWMTLMTLVNGSTGLRYQMEELVGEKDPTIIESTLLKSGYKWNTLEPDMDDVRKNMVFAVDVGDNGKKLTVTAFSLNHFHAFSSERYSLLKYEFDAGPSGGAKVSYVKFYSSVLETPTGYERKWQRLLAKENTYLWPEHKLIKFPNDHEIVVLKQHVYAEHAARTCFFQDEQRSFLAVSRPWGKVPIAKILSGIAPQFQILDLYHPHVDDMYGDMNRLGVAGLLDPPSTSDAYKRRKQLAFNLPSNTWFKDIYEATTSSFLIEDHPNPGIDFEEEDSFAVYNWELFFHIPMLIAERLKQNQRFEEARKWYHFVFNPTYVPEDPGVEIAPQSLWRMRHLSEVEPESLENSLIRLNDGDEKLLRCVKKWRKYPFKPHLVARYRPVAYMKNVVMKYMDNLIAWGDQLFNRDSIESINEATQLYILVTQILRDRPASLPTQEQIPKTYNELQAIGSGLGPFSNVLLKAEEKLTWQAPDVLIDPNTIQQLKKNETFVGPLPYPQLEGSLQYFGMEIESMDPMPIGDYSETSADGPPDLPTSFYFCIPHNKRLLKYWDTIADRLFKIRNCMNIKGVVRTLPLFQPPIDPALLVRAAAAGVDISTALADSNQTLPAYRFSTLEQKAQAMSSEVRSFGGALLSALEKKDSETLSRLTTGHRVKLLSAVTEVRKRQVKEAKASLEAINKQKFTVEQRKSYYQDLVDTGLSSSEEDNVDKLNTAARKQGIAKGWGIGSSIANMFPNISIGIAVVPTYSVSMGGSNVGAALRAVSEYYQAEGSFFAHKAQMSDIDARHERRKQEWEQQVKQADKELAQIEKQILATQIRVEIAEYENKNHLTEKSQAKEQERFLKSKFTDSELYGWMVSQLSGLYFQSYKLAYDLAKQAEMAFQHELGKERGSTNYIQFGYWDSLKKGLLAGEKMSFDLSRLDTAYLEENTRGYELTKNMSLAQLNPVALMKLREEGECFVHLPEAMFDLDYPTHLNRRIKSMALTIPCVAGPSATISCKLELISSQVRKTPSSPSLSTGNVPACIAIATSHAQNDSGMFELNFGDQRYLPFEGAGAVSQWKLSMPTLRRFERLSMTDVVFHLRYTASMSERATPATLPGTVYTGLNDMIVDNTQASPPEKGLMAMISIRHEFPEQWSDLISGAFADISFDPNTMVPVALRGEITDVTSLDVFFDVPEHTSSPTLSNGTTSIDDFSPLLNSTVYMGTLGSTDTSWSFDTDSESQGKAKDLIVVVHYTAT